jgi:hypothetical protein
MEEPYFFLNCPHQLLQSLQKASFFHMEAQKSEFKELE